MPTHPVKGPGALLPPTPFLSPRTNPILPSTQPSCRGTWAGGATEGKGLYPESREKPLRDVQQERDVIGSAFQKPRCGTHWRKHTRGADAEAGRQQELLLVQVEGQSGGVWRQWGVTSAVPGGGWRRRGSGREALRPAPRPLPCPAVP